MDVGLELGQALRLPWGVGGHGLGEAGKAYRLQLGPRVAEP
jgi:hypothetical protein